MTRTTCFARDNRLILHDQSKNCWLDVVFFNFTIIPIWWCNNRNMLQRILIANISGCSGRNKSQWDQVVGGNRTIKLFSLPHLANPKEPSTIMPYLSCVVVGVIGIVVSSCAPFLATGLDIQTSCVLQIHTCGPTSNSQSLIFVKWQQFWYNIWVSYCSHKWS